MQVAADVKCYYCGHVSGQIVGERGDPQHGRFEPRPGFQGEPPKAGERIHCERCHGPVYLEEASPIEMPFIRRRPRPVRHTVRPKLSGAA